MADIYTITLTIEKNSKPIQGFDPLIRRISVEGSEDFHALIGTATQTPLTWSGGSASIFALTTPVAAILYPRGGANGSIPLQANGLILLLNATLTPAAEIIQSSGETVVVKGVVGGL